MDPGAEALVVLRSNLSASLHREAAHARRLARMTEWSVALACCTQYLACWRNQVALRALPVQGIPVR